MEDQPPFTWAYCVNLMYTAKGREIACMLESYKEYKVFSKNLKQNGVYSPDKEILPLLTSLFRL